MARCRVEHRPGFNSVERLRPPPASRAIAGQPWFRAVPARRGQRRSTRRPGHSVDAGDPQRGASAHGGRCGMECRHQSSDGTCRRPRERSHHGGTRLQRQDRRRGAAAGSDLLLRLRSRSRAIADRPHEDASAGRRGLARTPRPALLRELSDRIFQRVSLRREPVGPRCCGTRRRLHLRIRKRQVRRRHRPAAHSGAAA